MTRAIMRQGQAFGAPSSKPHKVHRKALTGGPSQILAMQRLAGNQAVASWLGGQSVQRQGPGEEGPVVEISGSLPNKSPDDHAVKETKGPSDRSSGAATSESAGAPATGGCDSLALELEEPSVSVTEEETRDVTGLARRNDAVSSSVNSVSWTNPGGMAVDPFGEESFKAGYSNMTYKLKKKNKLAVSFNLDITCQWGVSPGGNTSIETGDEADIKWDTSKDVAKDLTPKKVEKCWVPPRATYWSSPISSRHEKFHSTDDKTWAKGAGKSHLKSYLNKKSVTLADDERKDKAQVEAKLKPILDDAMDDLETANIRDFYKGGAASYYSYKGEIRAFGDGKAPYLALVAKIKRQGKKLAKEEAARKKAEAKQAAAST